MDAAALLANVPDAPEFVEARAMLLSGDGVVLWTNGRSLVVHSPDDFLACVVGPAPAQELAATLSRLPPRTAVVLGEQDAASAGVPRGWNAEAAIVHIEPERFVAARVAGCEVRLINADDPLELGHVPQDVRGELEDAFLFAPLAVAFVQDTPAAFCRAGWVTESLWDVAIDTLEPWRGRGCGAAAAVALMEVMRARGRRAVWGALVSNTPSLRLAARLGFTPVSRVLILSR